LISVFQNTSLSRTPFRRLKKIELMMISTCFRSWIRCPRKYIMERNLYMNLRIYGKMKHVGHTTSMDLCMFVERSPNDEMSRVANSNASESSYSIHYSSMLAMVPRIGKKPQAHREFTLSTEDIEDYGFFRPFYYFEYSSSIRYKYLINLPSLSAIITFLLCFVSSLSFMRRDCTEDRRRCLS